MKDLAVVIPAYLEEENLRIILPRIVTVLCKLNINFEILIVDTQQPMDGTSNVCAAFEQVRYVNRLNGNFYGDAVRTGILEAQGTSIVFMDADGSHTPEFIPELYKRRDEFDVTIASRYIKGGGTDNNKVLILMSYIVNFLYSTILNLKCKDVSNSFKLYRADYLKKVSLSCNNFDIVEEILFKLKKNNKELKIGEIPYVFKERMFGNTKRNLIIFVFSFAYTLFRLRFGSQFKRMPGDK